MNANGAFRSALWQLGHGPLLCCAAFDVAAVWTDLSMRIYGTWTEMGRLISRTALLNSPLHPLARWDGRGNDDYLFNAAHFAVSGRPNGSLEVWVPGF